MKNFSTKTIIISVIGLVLVTYVWSAYNSLTKASVAVDTQWAQVENQLQRQFDLIPNLAATVKGASENEQKIFLGVAQARSGYANASTVDEKVQAANTFQAGLSKFMLSVEAYPNVASTQAFRDFSVDLTGTQNRITVERGRFNEEVSKYNLGIRTFPKNILASLFGFKTREFFKAQEAAQTTPKVNF
jgi:LemA protein